MKYFLKVSRKVFGTQKKRFYLFFFLHKKLRKHLVKRSALNKTGVFLKITLKKTKNLPYIYIYF